MSNALRLSSTKSSSNNDSLLKGNCRFQAFSGSDGALIYNN